MSNGFKANMLTLNLTKTKFMIFKPKGTFLNDNLSDLKLKVGGVVIERIGKGCNTESFKFVGVKLDDNDKLCSYKG